MRRALTIGGLLVVTTLALAVGAEAVTVATSDELVAAMAAGGVVWVEPGDYVLATTLVIDRDVELRSVEPLAATLLLQGAPAGLRVEGGAHARLVDLRLVHDGAAAGDLVRVHDARATLEAVAIGLAVAEPGAPDPAFPLDDARAAGRGLLLTGTAHVEVIGGNVGRNEGAAAELRDAARLYVEGALFAGNGAGVVATDDASVELREAELRDHHGFALALHGRAAASGEGNRFEENGVAEGERLISAVYVGDQATLDVSGDAFRDHPGGAFELAGAARVRLEGVTVEATGTWAHTYAVGQATLHVVGGTFVGNDGAVFAGEGARVVLDGVTLADGAAEGVMADDHAFVTVQGGRIEGHAGIGVAVYGDARAHVDGATVARARSGLVAMGAATLVVRDTDVVDHERTGVAFLDASTGEVSANRFRGLPVGLGLAVGATPVVGVNAFTDVARPQAEVE